MSIILLIYLLNRYMSLNILLFVFLNKICHIDCLRTKPIASRIIRLTGTSALSLQCDVPEARLRDSTRITWYHDGEMIQMGGIYSIGDDYGLLSRLVTEQQIGTYQCTVSNKGQVSRGRKVRVFLSYPYFAAPLRENTPAVLHSDVKLQCVIKEDGKWTYNHGTPKWLYNGTKDVKSQHCPSRSKSQSCRTISADNTLLIENIQLSDAGMYTCQYAWKGGPRARTPMSMDTRLIVYRTPTFLLQWPTKMEVDTGSNISLSCNMDEPTNEYIIEWHKDKDDLPTDHHTVENGTLHIENMTREDSGLYSCIVTTLRPVRTTLRQSALIHVNSPPLAIALWVTQLSMTRVNVSWLPGDDGGYAIDSFGFQYVMTDEQGQTLDHEQAPFILTKDLHHTEIEALVSNRSYRLTVWANNSLGAGEKTSVVFDTFPGNHLHTFSASPVKPITGENEEPISIYVIASVASVTSLFVVVAAAIGTVALLVLYRKHCGPDSDRARRQYRVPEESNADFGMSDADENNNSGASSNSHLDQSDDVTKAASQSLKSSTPIRYKLPSLAFSNPAFEDESMRLDESVDSGRDDSIVVGESNILSPGAPVKSKGSSYAPLCSHPEDPKSPERDSNHPADLTTSGNHQRAVSS